LYKMKKYILSFLIAVFSIVSVYAQPSLDFWNKKGYFKFGAGGLIPGKDFSSTDVNGLFAKNGYQIGFDLNYMFAYGLGMGMNLGFDRFNFDSDAFYAYSKAETMKHKGRYGSTKFGLNILMNVPILVMSENFVINLYGEGNAGLRGLNIPEIDLTYNEIANKYTEVSYRSRANTMGYLGYNAGLQFLFSNKYGINLSYNEVLPSRHSIGYSVRMFDAEGRLTEKEDYLNNYLDHKGFQIAFIILFGKE